MGAAGQPVVTIFAQLTATGVVNGLIYVADSMRGLIILREI